MAKFGSKTDSEGNEVQGDSTFTIPETGYIDNCIFESAGPYKDQEGNVVEGRAVITFKQPGGADVRRVVFEPKESDNPKAPSLDEQLDILNREMKHICTKFAGVDEEKFHKETEADDFKTFIKNCFSLMENAKEESNKVGFRLACAYDNNGFFGLRKFPNFIESMEIPRESTTLQWNSKYDHTENPNNKKKEEAAGEPVAESGNPDW